MEVEKDGGANALERKGESPTRIQVNAFMLQSIQRIYRRMLFYVMKIVRNNNTSSLKNQQPLWFHAEEVGGCFSSRPDLLQPALQLLFIATPSWSLVRKIGLLVVSASISSVKIMVR